MEHTLFLIGQEVGDIKRRVQDLESSLGEIVYWLRRAGVLISLWALGVVTNYSGDRAAELVADILKQLIVP